MTRRSARQRSPRKRTALRREITRNADLLQFLRLMAAASPELSSIAFMCDSGVETSGLDCEIVVRTEASRHFECRAQHVEARGGALFDLPLAEAHIVRLPLVPTRRLARERKPPGHRVRRFASSVVTSIGRAASGP